MRTKAAWLIVVPFLVLARPTTGLLIWGAGLAALGLLLRGWSAGTIEKGEALATTGPYAFTRNPLYLGSFILGFGLALSGGHWMWPVAFGAFFWVVYVPTMKREAEQLHDVFGPRYAEYAAQVPTFLPRLSPFRTGSVDEGRFQWSRYLRYREWEALVGAATVLAILFLRLRVGA